MTYRFDEGAICKLYLRMEDPKLVGIKYYLAIFYSHKLESFVIFILMVRLVA